MWKNEASSKEETTFTLKTIWDNIKWQNTREYNREVLLRCFAMSFDIICSKIALRFGRYVENNMSRDLVICFSIYYISMFKHVIFVYIVWWVLFYVLHAFSPYFIYFRKLFLILNMDSPNLRNFSFGAALVLNV